MKTHELFDLDPYARPRMTFNLPMPDGLRALRLRFSAVNMAA